MVRSRFLRFPGIALSLLLLLSGLGCERVKVAMGWTLPLGEISLSGLEVQLEPEGGLAPGEGGRLFLKAMTRDGRVYWSKGRGPLRWKDFAVEVVGADLDGNGRVSLAEDPRALAGGDPRVRILPPGVPELAVEVRIPVRYDKAFLLDWSGRRGASGFSGTDGSSGLSGSPGSCSPGQEQAGGNGSDGSDGGRGEDGRNGEPGPEVQVWVTREANGRGFLQVKVESVQGVRFFLIDPGKGSLTVRADGGAGGSGGQGGRGGRGGSGGMGCPNGQDGRNGSDGSSGWDGAPGEAGRIIVHYDPAVRSALGAFHGSNRDGRGRPGRAVEFWMEAIPPLW